MNYPIFFRSTFQLSNDELKKYIFYFQDHNYNFTKLGDISLISFHKYEDNLHIRLEWAIEQKNKQECQIPSDINMLFTLEENGIITYKKGEILQYSLESLSTIPNDETYNIFHFHIRSARIPLSKEDYTILEFPKLIREPKIKDEELFNMVQDYLKFQEYLSKRNIENQKNDR